MKFSSASAGLTLGLVLLARSFAADAAPAVSPRRPRDGLPDGEGAKLAGEHKD